MSPRCAVGFRAKTGWAAVVLLESDASGTRVLDSRRLDLCDPEAPAARQPYHAGFGTFNEDDGEVKRLVLGVHQFAARAIGSLLAGYDAVGHAPRAGAVVAGSAVDPARIANLHMRAHALEGRLYREVVEEALAEAGLRCELLLERDLYLRAAERLGMREAALKKAVAELGRGVGGGWRAESKAAAVAAWLALGSRAQRRSA
jgi:hypothetical protein